MNGTLALVSGSGDGSDHSARQVQAQSKAAGVTFDCSRSMQLFATPIPVSYGCCPVTGELRPDPAAPRHPAPCQASSDADGGHQQSGCLHEALHAAAAGDGAGGADRRAARGDDSAVQAVAVRVSCYADAHVWSSVSRLLQLGESAASCGKRRRCAGVITAPWQYGSGTSRSYYISTAPPSNISSVL